MPVPFPAGQQEGFPDGTAVHTSVCAWGEAAALTPLAKTPAEFASLNLKLIKNNENIHIYIIYNTSTDIFYSIMKPDDIKYIELNSKCNNTRW